MGATRPVLNSLKEELAGVRRHDQPVDLTLEDIRQHAMVDKLELFGLAFSGGGIRSATFNLGILQQLDRLKLLQYVDYLSTVSGGGYVGSWYLSCLRQAKDSETLRKPTIEHLRKFSQYLAPSAGFFSVDTWTIVMIWLRNTVLLQTMLACFFALLLLAPRLLENVFLYANPALVEYMAVGLFGGSITFMVLSLWQLTRTERSPALESPKVVQAVAILGMLGSGAFASAMWHSLRQPDPFAAQRMQYLGGALVFLAAWFTAFFSLVPKQRIPRWFIGTGLIASACAVLSYLMNGVVIDIYARMDPKVAPWVAGILGAPAVLFILSLCVVLQIGLLGRAIGDTHREWWSRFGALLVIYSVGPLALSLIAVFGPRFVEWLLSPELHGWIARTVTLSGVASIIGGIYAGRSPDTGARKPAPIKNFFATIAPYLFIVSLLIAVSAGLHQILIRVPVCYSDSGYWDALGCSITEGRLWLLGLFGAFLVTLIILAWRIDINEASMNPFYRNRLVRCFQGAARVGYRKPHAFTGFDTEDDFCLGELRPEYGYAGPVPIVNSAVNRTGGGDAGVQERRAASFFFTPYRTGSDFTGTIDTHQTGRDEHGLRLGACVATSGAAASPNMGYHTSGSIAFLLTFFNVRLGMWLRNPTCQPQKFGSRWGFYYLLKELMATADVKDRYIYLSDGGHFENLGIYELVRRRCRFIIAGDGEQDGDMELNSLGGVVRKCRIDFG
ncbi:MAG: patatin-like phospholipase family protein, partial [Acidobacteriota bacterium]